MVKNKIFDIIKGGEVVGDYHTYTTATGDMIRITHAVRIRGKAIITTYRYRHGQRLGVYQRGSIDGITLNTNQMDIFSTLKDAGYDIGDRS